MRPSTSFGESPLNCQMTEMTGMLGDGEHAPDGDQHRHHDERVRPAEGEADDPHRSTYGPSVRMIRGIASSSLIATAVPLRTRELGDPEAARPWNTLG